MKRTVCTKLVRLQVVMASVALLFLVQAQLVAGGPENVLLVVNADSASSKLIANHYIALRKIPSQNVVYIQGLKDTERTSVDEFRKRILKPVFAEIEKRGLAASIDYIVYSADFPTAINNAVHWKKLEARYKDLPRERRPDRRVYTPIASINSLTFYTAAVMTDEPGYMLLDSNNYYRKPASVLLRRPFGGPLQKKYEEAVERLEADSEAGWKTSQRELEQMAKQNPGQLAVAYSLARCYARMNDAKKSATWLARSVALGWSYKQQTLADTLFDAVKEDDSFQAVVSKIPNLPFDFVPTMGFRSRLGYGANGMINSTPNQGNRHYLSTVLAITRNQGNTEREALDQLRRSVRADGTMPQGKFYFIESSDIRSKTRQPQFESAMRALKLQGYASEIAKTKMPFKARAVLGITSGTPSFNWTQSGSKLVPGAIGDNFTSYGGRMDSPGQTKLTEFLKNGAAGASGTVIEPYTIPNKFPHAMIHAHYTRGCTLAESYYQSVAGPMQLLIVGDALCRPFGKKPTIKVNGIQPNTRIKGTVNCSFDISDSPKRVASIELFIDGRLAHKQAGVKPFKLDTTGLSDGYHEIRFVAVETGLIGATGHQIIPVNIANRGHSVELSSQHNDFLHTDMIKLTAKSNWGDAIGLVQNGRMIAKKEGQVVKFNVPAALVGRGPVKLEAIAISESAAPQSFKTISSYPVSLEIEGRLSQVRRNTNQPKKKK